MSNNETLADIISIMRSEPLYNPHGDPALVEANKVLKNYADRVEAAAQREKVEAVTIAATKAVNLTDVKWRRDTGNASAMREALAKCLDVLSDITITCGCDKVDDAKTMARAALSAPARNCDVGTAEEQCLRFWQATEREPETARSVGGFSRWAQMPYEADKAKGGEDGQHE